MQVNVTIRQGMPCQGCEDGKFGCSRKCDESPCKSWRQWFLSCWRRLNRYYAWQQMDSRGRECFTYELPHVKAESPCQGCSCESWCDTPCSQRLKWWDQGMDTIRRRAGHGAADTETKTVC